MDEKMKIWLNEQKLKNGCKPYFKSLCDKKSEGHVLNFKEFPETNLFTLYLEERVTQKEIATLFNATINQVGYRIRKMGLDNKEFHHRAEYLQELYSKENPGEQVKLNPSSNPNMVAG